jgi:site-specific DNA-methyltransferase (adenine-specific)
MELMAEYEENYFDLAIVDPPYGIERFKKPSGKTRFKTSEMMQQKGLEWDKAPSKKYFDALFRVSKNQIVWGANNFIMPKSEYFCIWDKLQTVDNFASAEYAWVSMGLKKPAKVFRYSIHRHNTDKFKIHPTQKPVKLYTWLLSKYAKQGDNILDTHVGSASSLIACHQLSFDVVGCELDKNYYELAQKRIKEETSQLSLF